MTTPKPIPSLLRDEKRRTRFFAYLETSCSPEDRLSDLARSVIPKGAGLVHMDFLDVVAAVGDFLDFHTCCHGQEEKHVDFSGQYGLMVTIANYRDVTVAEVRRIWDLLVELVSDSQRLIDEAA